MTYRTMLFAGIAALLIPGFAEAGTGQCYNSKGKPIGPTYDTDHPDYAHLEWVKQNGGECIRVGSHSSHVPRYPQDRPHNYQSGEPSFFATDHRPSDVSTDGDPRQAAALLREHFHAMGYHHVSVTTTQKHVQIHDKTWRMYQVHWLPEHYEYIAVHRNPNGDYTAHRYLGDQGWSRVVRLGQ